MGDGDGDVRARGPQALLPSQSLDFAVCKMEAFLRMASFSPSLAREPPAGAPGSCFQKDSPGLWILEHVAMSRVEREDAGR